MLKFANTSQTINMPTAMEINFAHAQVLLASLLLLHMYQKQCTCSIVWVLQKRNCIKWLLERKEERCRCME